MAFSLSFCLIALCADASKKSEMSCGGAGERQKDGKERTEERRFKFIKKAYLLNLLDLAFVLHALIQLEFDDGSFQQDCLRLESPLLKHR